MVSCAEFLEEIGNYLEGEVAEEVRAQLERHLSHCQTCTVLVDSTRKTLRIVAGADSFDLPPAAFDAVRGRIMERIRETLE